MSNLSRRTVIRAALAGTTGLSGIALAVRAASENGLIPPDAGGVYGVGHTLTYAAQRLLTRNANAREFTRSQISKIPHPTGKAPKGADFPRLQAAGFQDWQLQVDGMVDRPASFSLAELKRQPSRSQITQLVCEEGWSYIAEWTGVPLSQVLQLAGASPKAKYIVYYGMDGWLDAIDMEDARHAQTQLSYKMNQADLSIGHGGPLRLRLPRQLGYKSIKYLNRLTVTDTLKGVPLETGYSWFAGI